MLLLISFKTSNEGSKPLPDIIELNKRIIENNIFYLSDLLEGYRFHLYLPDNYLNDINELKTYDVSVLIFSLFEKIKFYLLLQILLIGLIK
jgi:hypothetical protein